MGIDLRGRLGAVALVAGGVLALVANAMTPRVSDTLKSYTEMATSKRWMIANVMLLVAIVLIVAGLVRLAERISDRRSECADLGRVAAIIGGTIAVAQLVVQISAYRHQAEIWTQATDGTANFLPAFFATNSIDHINAALQAGWAIVLVGFAPLLLGAAMIRSAAFPRPVALLGVLSGLATVVVSYLLLVNDNHDALDIPFAVVSVAVTLWVIACGWILLNAPTPSHSSDAG